MSALDEHLKKHRRKIIEREEVAFRELLNAYGEIEKDLKKSFDDLQQKILDAQSAGEEISPSWFFRERRLKNLLAQVQQQINRFGATATRIIEREQRAAIQIAIRQVQENFDFEIEQTDFPERNFASTLNPRTVETAVGLMGDGSPIREYFEQQLAPLVAGKIKSEVIKASALGTDFKRIARVLQETGDITKFRALSVARTEVNRVRRETTRQIYEDNSDILEGWEWVASKSTRTCPLCLAMDGRRFPLDEPFPQHVNCRCTMKSVIIDLPAKKRTLGKDYFENLSDEDKEKILGKETFLAYKEHGLTLDDFVTFRNDKRFGKSVSRKPLAKILSEKGISDDKNFEEINLPKNIKVSFEYGTKKKLQTLLGKKLKDDEVGALVGAFDDAKISVTKAGENLFFNINHPLISRQERTLGRDYANRLYFHNDYFRASANAPKGTGAKSFTVQALTAKKFGIEYVHTFAAGEYGNKRFNGYYTWARMGYDAELTDEDRAALPKKFKNIKTLNELMLAGGKDDWKIKGTERDMIFDLSDDSDSLKILKNYLLERGFVVRF